MNSPVVQNVAPGVFMTLGLTCSKISHFGNATWKGQAGRNGSLKERSRKIYQFCNAAWRGQVKKRRSLNDSPENPITKHLRNFCMRPD